MTKPTPKTMQPEDFNVNQTWLAFRINLGPLHVETQEVDLYILQDAASMYIFGNALAPHGADWPEVDEVEKLFEAAHSLRDEWPTELVLPGRPARENSFTKVARSNGIAVRSVPESQLSFYIKDTQEAYEEVFARGADGS